MKELLAKSSEAEDVVFFLVPFNGGTSGSCNMGIGVVGGGCGGYLEGSVETFVGDRIPAGVDSFVNQTGGFELIPNVSYGLVVFGIRSPREDRRFNVGSFGQGLRRYDTFNDFSEGKWGRQTLNR